jgi:hypothetical protein
MRKMNKKLWRSGWLLGIGGLSAGIGAAMAFLGHKMSTLSLKLNEFGVRKLQEGKWLVDEIKNPSAETSDCNSEPS